MKNKIKLLCLSLCASLLLGGSLVGCDGNSSDSDTESLSDSENGTEDMSDTEDTKDTEQHQAVDKKATLEELAELIIIAEDIGRGNSTDDEWDSFLSLVAEARALDENSDGEAMLKVKNELKGRITLMNIGAIPEKVGNIYKLKYNRENVIAPIQVGLRSSPAFYDIDGDGKKELVVAGYGRSYSGLAGGSITAYKSLDGKVGSCEFETLGILFSGTSFPIWSQKTDGSSVFVTQNGEMYTEIGTEGYGEKRTFTKLTGYFKLYDVDGDGKSDAVYVKNSGKGENTYDENGNSNVTYTSTMYWLKNTGSEAYPLFAGSPIPFMDDKGGEFTVNDPTQYAYVKSFCLVDLDGDGDLDLIAGGWLNEFYYYENVGTAKNPKFKSAGVKLRTVSGEMKLPSCRYDAITYDFDGDGKDDFLIGGDTGDVTYFRFTGRFDPDTGAPVFEDGRLLNTVSEYVSTPSLSRPTVCDFDGDGKEDILVGDSAGDLWFVKNLTGGAEPQWEVPVRLTDENGRILRVKAGKNGSLQGLQEAEWGYLIPVACDWDGDGDVDVIANSVTGRIILFENIGTASKPQLTQPKPVEVEWKNGNLSPKEYWWRPTGKELVTQHRTTPFAIDFNGDGLCDLVMLDHEGYLAFYERYKENGVLKLKQGERIFVDESGKPLKLTSSTVGETSINGGHIGRVKIAVTDYDGDGMPDVIVNGKSFVWYRTTKIENGKYYLKNMGELDSGNISGHDQGFTIVDFDGDGRPDILSGSESGYLYYFKNNK